MFGAVLPQPVHSLRTAHFQQQGQLRLVHKAARWRGQKDSLHQRHEAAACIQSAGCTYIALKTVSGRYLCVVAKRWCLLIRAYFGRYLDLGRRKSLKTSLFPRSSISPRFAPKARKNCQPSMSDRPRFCTRSTELWNTAVQSTAVIMSLM